MPHKPRKTVTRKVSNPTGKGGFGDHPEHIRWRPQDTVVFWIKNYLKKTRAEFQAVGKDYEEGKLTQAQELAYMQVIHAHDETDRGLRRLTDIEDRTEDLEVKMSTTDGPAVVIEFPTVTAKNRSND